MERIKNIKEQLIAQVQSQMGDLRKVDTKELGEAIDMIKDLAETVYYCEVAKAMEEAQESKRESNNNYYYSERFYDPMYYRDMDRHDGRMYYSADSATSGTSNGNTGTRTYTERNYPLQLHDDREGRSPITRKMYMESKAMNHPSSKTTKELETYFTELTTDMMEMVDKASLEEKNLIKRKVDALASKIQNV